MNAGCDQRYLHQPVRLEKRQARNNDASRTL
jgi:hypothetical protein